MLIPIDKRFACNLAMRTIEEIRLANLAILVQEFGSQDAVARLADSSPVYLSQLINHTPDNKTGRPREMGPRLARKLEAGCNRPRGWMDEPHLPLSWRQQQLDNIHRVMDAMPDDLLKKTAEIVNTLAQPSQSPSPDPNAARDYRNPRSYPKSEQMRDDSHNSESKRGGGNAR